MKTYAEILNEVLGTIGAPVSNARKSYFDKFGVCFDLLDEGRRLLTDADDDKDAEDERIFDSFNNQRLIEETFDGTHFTSNWSTKKNREYTSEEFEAVINWRISKMVFQGEQEVGFAQSIFNRFQSFDRGYFINNTTKDNTDAENGIPIPPMEHRDTLEEPVFTQLDRIIFEECNVVGNKVRPVQLRTGDSTPSTYRPEEVMQWAKCTIDEAVKLVEAYRWIEPTFEASRAMNKAAASRNQAIHPVLSEISDWNDPESIANRMHKFSAGKKKLAKSSRECIRQLVPQLSPVQFNEYFPENTISIIDIARAIKQSTTYELDDAYWGEAVEDTDEWSDCYCYKRDSRGSWRKTRIEDTEATEGVEDWVTCYEQDKRGPSYESSVDGALYATGELEYGYSEDEDDPDETDDEGFRDSEAFGYWFPSITPVNRALQSHDVRFFKIACKAVAKASTPTQLGNLRKNIFSKKPNWNFHQTREFWALCKRKQRIVTYKGSKYKGDLTAQTV